MENTKVTIEEKRIRNISFEVGTHKVSFNLGKYTISDEIKESIEKSLRISNQIPIITPKEQSTKTPEEPVRKVFETKYFESMNRNVILESWNEIKTILGNKFTSKEYIEAMEKLYNRKMDPSQRVYSLKVLCDKNILKSVGCGKYIRIFMNSRDFEREFVIVNNYNHLLNKS